MVDGRKTAEHRETAMQISQTEHLVGRYCRLLKPVRDRDGRSRFSEQPRVIRELDNLGRRMYLVQFSDGSTTFLFPDEVVVE
jgi:hypothetical protein